jgi:hypothetical protein
MMPPKHRPTNRVIRGLTGFGLAACAVMLVCGLRMEEARKTADAAPDRPADCRRPQQSRESRITRSKLRPAISPDDLIEISVESGLTDPELLVAIPRARIREALDNLRTSGHGETEVFKALLRRWAAADVASVAAWAERSPAGSSRQLALEILAIEWANTDLSSTAEWARQLPDATEQQTLLLAAANEAVRTDPVEALRLAVEFPEATEGRDTIRRAAMEWASKDAAGAMEWAKTIPDEALRHTILAAEFVAWAETAPDAAATHALESLPDGRLLDDTLVSIVQRWAQTDARAAAAWVERFPPGPLRAAAVENLLSQWRQSDPVAAQGWQPGS